MSKHSSEVGLKRITGDDRFGNPGAKGPHTKARDRGEGLAVQAETLADLLDAEQCACAIGVMALIQTGLIDLTEIGRPVAVPRDDLGGFQSPKSSRRRGGRSSLMRALSRGSRTLLLQSSAQSL